MKKAAKILGIVAMVLSIVAAVCCLLGGLIGGIVWVVAAAAIEDAGEAAGAIVVAIVEAIFLIGFAVVCLIGAIFSSKFNKALAVAKSSEEMKKPAILEIVFGALTNTVGIVAGIFALVMNEEAYSKEDNINAPDLEKALKKPEKKEAEEEKAE